VKNKRRIKLKITRKKLKPELDGEFWMIGDNPDLGELNGHNLKMQACVDHHVFQSLDGKWHLWGCIRGTAQGRLLYHWESESLKKVHWEKTGEIIRSSTQAGESIEDWGKEEWIQSPFIVKEEAIYYMFYGGHSTGHDGNGNFIDEGFGSSERLCCRTECQMCLMTSIDGIHWNRYSNEIGQSRIFVGPGEVRDPSLLKIDGLWHMYYAGCHVEEGKSLPAIYVRTSKDLINWSEWRVVHWDLSSKFGSGRWGTECPNVVEREGYYYLFRTEEYPTAKTHVFRSEDPYDFGKGNGIDKYVCSIRVAAPEIIVDEYDQEYITSNHDLTGGTQLCKLKWVADNDAVKSLY
jgi:hypothetical protein